MTTETEILQYLHYHPLSKRMEIGHAVTTEISERTCHCRLCGKWVYRGGR